VTVLLERNSAWRVLVRAQAWRSCRVSFPAAKEGESSRQAKLCVWQDTRDLLYLHFVEPDFRTGSNDEDFERNTFQGTLMFTPPKTIGAGKLSHFVYSVRAGLTSAARSRIEYCCKAANRRWRKKGSNPRYRRDAWRL